MLVRRSTFNQQLFDENYKRCGEDVQLNLDLREKLNGKVMLCPGMSGVHIESATRAENDESGNTSEDLVKMRTRRRLFLEQASAWQLRAELSMAAREHAFIEEMMTNKQGGLTLKQERDHWKRETQALQLEILRLKDLTKRQQEEMNVMSARPQLLKGKRILVTALDLEQREHRGIAVYSKALIRHLRRMGAEVWLLTQFKPITSDLRRLPRETQRIIYSSRTLNELVHGKTVHVSRLEQLIPLLSKLGNRYRRIRKSLKGVFIKTSFQFKELRSFHLSELSDNPNLRIKRLDYLQDVEGIVSLTIYMKLANWLL